jgi:folate-binding protein YgfZ
LVETKVTTAAGFKLVSGRYAFAEFPPRATILLQGPDGRDLLQRISTNDFSGLAEGKPVTTILLTEKGRMVDLVTACRVGADQILLFGSTEKDVDLQQWIDRYVIMDQVTALPFPGLSCVFLVWNNEQFNSSVQREASTAYHLELSMLASTISNEKCISFVESYRSCDVLHFHAPGALAESIRSGLLGMGATTTGLAEFEQMRIAAGIPLWPNEIAGDFNPLEAGLRDFISFSKGCYVGQEVVARLETYGKVQRELTQLILDRVPAQVPQSLIFSGEEVGILTSVSHKRMNRGYPGLGYVRSKFIASLGKETDHVECEGLTLQILSSLCRNK